MDKKAIKEAGQQIANQIDVLPTEQMVLDMIEGAAVRLNVNSIHVKKAVHDAQEESYWAAQSSEMTTGNFGANIH